MRKIHILVGFLSVLSSGCSNSRNEGKIMDSATLEKWFTTGLGSRGDRYIEARDQVTAEGSKVLPFLQSKSLPLDDSGASLMAVMWIGWITEKALYEEITRQMKGGSRTQVLKPPASGEWSGSSRGQSIAAHGKKATPRILEILTKSREHRDQAQQEALFVALALLKDSRSVPALLDFLASGPGDGVKTRAAYAIGQIGDPRALGALSSNLLNEDNGPELRKTCATSIGLLRDPRGVDPLIEILSRDQDNAELKGAAALALGVLGDRRASASLTARLEKEQNSELLTDILGALEDVGTSASLPVVNRIAQTFPEESVRERAKEAHSVISARLKSEGVR